MLKWFFKELGKQLKEEKDSERKEDIKSAMTRLVN